MSQLTKAGVSQRIFFLTVEYLYNIFNIKFYMIFYNINFDAFVKVKILKIRARNPLKSLGVKLKKVTNSWLFVRPSTLQLFKSSKTFKIQMPVLTSKYLTLEFGSKNRAKL